MTEPAYDTIGRGYAAIRQSDPRIGARIEVALGDCESVLNVGAGTGSYEPTSREVTAVEPSPAMIAQRPAGGAPVVQASAEDLPFGDDSFDVAMAVLSVHHFANRDAGIVEMGRVRRRRIVILTLDPLTDGWAHDYWPELGEVARARLPSIDVLVAALPDAVVETVMCPRDCRDGFYPALWDRPELLLDPEVRRSSSGFHGVSPEAVNLGASCLRVDLHSGRWDERYAHLRELDELDIGLRLVVSAV